MYNLDTTGEVQENILVILIYYEIRKVDVGEGALASDPGLKSA